MLKGFAHPSAVSCVENLGATELGIKFRRGQSLLCLLEDMQCIHRAQHWGIEIIEDLHLPLLPRSPGFLREWTC